MSEIEVTTLTPDFWEDYKNLNLEAAQSDPLAFGLTEEEVSRYSEQYYRERLEKAGNGENVWMFFARKGSQLVGMVAANIAHEGSRQKFKHIALVHSVYVNKEFRGQGIGTLLMDTLIAELEKHPGILKAQMGVAATQDSALNLYKKFGFEVVGKREKTFKNGDEFIVEILMDKFFDR